MYLTSLERAVEKKLVELGVEFEAQYPTQTGFVIDFALLSEGIAIEVDGERWHSSKKAKRHDNFKNYQLKREGWKVLRIKEREMNDLDRILSQCIKPLC